MIIALKVGGSVFCPTEKPDTFFAERLAETLRKLSRSHRLVVTVGGGKLARKMIESARKKGSKSHERLHKVGIDASRKNARYLVDILDGAAHPYVPESEEAVKKAFAGGKIVVTGGFRPGQTTDTVAMQCALSVGAELLVIGTDVKGVYTKDPKKYSDAIFMSEMSPEDLVDMAGTGAVKPGTKTVVDSIAARMIAENAVKVAVVDIRDLQNLESLIAGEDFEGTVIG
ncbi:MAG: UMP kinase [Candidatus Aenigmatarchaeota archaeon]